MSESEGHKYYRGYPGKLEQKVAQQPWCGMWFCAPFLILSSLGTYGYLIAFLEDRKLVYALALLLYVPVLLVSLLFFSCAVLFIRGTLFPHSFGARIVCYFRQQAGDTEDAAFRRGFALARNCQRLDRLAAEMGLEPLSAFGFEDDHAREQVEWHSPGSGLETVTGLIRRIEQDPECVPDASATLADLQAIETALQKAADHGVDFCFLLRIGRSLAVSPKEIESRQGSFW